MNGTSLNHSTVNGINNPQNPSIDSTTIAPLPLTHVDLNANTNKPNGTTHSDDDVDIISLSSNPSSDLESLQSHGIVFDTAAVLRDSIVLRHPPDIIEDGYVQKFMARWLERWVS